MIPWTLSPLWEDLSASALKFSRNSDYVDVKTHMRCYLWRGEGVCIKHSEFNLSKSEDS